MRPLALAYGMREDGEVDLRWRPTVAGPLRAQLVIDSNSGQFAVPFVLPTTSAPRPVAQCLYHAQSHRRRQPLHVGGIGAVLSGRSFFLNPTPTFPLTVPSASAASLPVDYTASPTPGQLDNDEFEVASDDPDQPRVRLTLQGLAGGPRISVPPDFIDFHVVRQVPAQTNVAIRNDGSSDLTVESIRLETGQDFSLQSVPSLPATVTAGA